MHTSAPREASTLRSVGLTALFFSTVVPSLSWAQEPVNGGPQPQVPATSTVGAENSAREAEWSSGVDGGAPIIRKATSYDPALPRPIPQVVRPGKDTDEVLAEASGDPHFLGFANGKFYPPSNERVDARLAEALLAGFDDERPSQETYAYVMLEKRISPETIRSLEETGARVLGYYPYQAVRVALDLSSFSILSNHPDVRWLGLPQTEHKFGRNLLAWLGVHQSGEQVALHVGVYEDDQNEDSVREAGPQGRLSKGDRLEADSTVGGRLQANGWQQRLIEQAGATVLYYEASARAFRVEASVDQVQELLELDCVSLIEPAEPIQTMHDDTVAMVSGDMTRLVSNGSQGLVNIGVIDSGFDIAHEALDSGFYIGWDVSGASQPNPFVDVCTGHGSHVLGTVLGNPEAPEDDFTGVIPFIGPTPGKAARLVKASDPTNCGFLFFEDGYDATFALMHDIAFDGTNLVFPAHVVNNSYGVGACNNFGICTPFGGTDLAAIAVDNEVWDHGTTMVFSGGNDGVFGNSTINAQGGAKNAFTVGAVEKAVSWDSADLGNLTENTPGERASFSSTGPMTDGRWKPNVVAPGVDVMSVDLGTGDGYRLNSGTSMAAPHVTGVIAQVMERNEFLRREPHRVASLLMATANTKGDVLLTKSTDAHLNQYGAGRVDAYRAYEDSNDSTWTNWGFELQADEEAFEDFTVPSNCKRLVVVMHYIEPPAMEGANQALVNDFDLVIDRAPFSSSISSGDYILQQSAVDNTEIRHLLNPAAGSWRWKIYPDSAATDVKVSVTVHMLLGDQAPEGSLTLSSPDIYVKPNETAQVDAELSTDTGMLSASWLSGYSNTAGIGSLFVNVLSSTVELADGIVADMMDNSNSDNGTTINLGNVHVGTPRRVSWDLKWPLEGIRKWNVIARSDNGVDLSGSIDIIVDGTPPQLPTGLTSTSHTPNVWSNDTEVDLSWNASLDNLAGVSGYGIFDTTSPSMPGSIQDIDAVTSHTSTFSSGSAGWYFNLRPVDNSGNWSTSHVSSGPYLIDTVKPGPVQNLTSVGVKPNEWINTTSFTMKWLEAVDTLSGVDGYGIDVSFGGPEMPAALKDIEAVENTVVTLPGDGSSWYVNVRSVDTAGNWSDSSVAVGPFRVDTSAPTITQMEFADIANGQIVTETSEAVIDVLMSTTEIGSGIELMRVQNTAGFFSPWMPFSAGFEWDLLSYGGVDLPGPRTVTVELQDLAGNVSSQSTLIYYYPHQTYGSACAGILGTPTISASGSVRTGEFVNFTVGNSAAAAASLYVGFSENVWQGLPLPLDLAGFGSPGCTIDAALDMLLYSGNQSSAIVLVPDNPSLIGETVYLEWLLFGDAGGAQILTTEGLKVRILD